MKKIDSLPNWWFCDILAIPRPRKICHLIGVLPIEIISLNSDFNFINKWIELDVFFFRITFEAFTSLHREISKKNAERWWICENALLAKQGTGVENNGLMKQLLLIIGTNQLIWPIQSSAIHGCESCLK